MNFCVVLLKGSESFVSEPLDIEVCQDTLTNMIVSPGKGKYAKKAQTSKVLD